MTDTFLTGRSAIVTGGGRGLGRAIARGLALAGVRVVLTAAHELAEIEATAREIADEMGDGFAVPADYVDTHFRTLTSVASRGIMGHSMGGYGALMLGFRHPEVFSNIYAMSPCCTILDADIGPSSPIWSRTQEIKSAAVLSDLLKQDFLLVVAAAMNAAFAPNPRTQPMLGDPPFRLRGQQQVPDPIALSKFQQNIVTNAVPLLLPKIHQLQGIYIDYGAEDEFSHIPPGARALSAQLALSGVPHILEVYEGDHGNHVRQRVEERALPWFSKRLKH
jgi:S-formylglutathione hydrolase